MPSVLTRLASLFPGYRPAPAPDARAEAVIKDTKAALDASTRRGRPASEEKIPKLYHGGVAGTVWFLPYRDSATKDTADIRAAMRLMRRDGYVKAAWEPQILAIEGEDWQVQPAESGNPESEAQAKFVKTALEDYVSGGLRSIIRAVCAPLGSDGFSIAEKVWGYAARGRLAGKFVCTAVKAKDPEDGLRVEGDKFGNVTGVTSLRNPGEHFPISDFLYSRYLHVFDEPLGEAAFRAAYGAYWMRDTVRKLRVIHHEKKMAGLLMGTYQDDADKAGLEAALRAAKTATWISVPEGVKVEAIALSTANETDYKSFDESLRDEMVTAIAFATLQMLLGNAPGGVRGDSEVQKQTSDLGPWLLMTIVTEVVNTQLISDLIDFNFSYAAGGYPKLSFGAVSADAILKEQQVVTGAMAAGMKPSKKHYAKTWGIQLADPDDPDDQLQAATTAPPPGAPPAPLPFAERGPGPTRACFSEPPADEVALAGKDGRRAATLLGNAKREGVAVLSRLTEAAVGRMLASGTALTSPVLFTDDELRELSESFAATVAAADLLGRSRVRRRAEMAAEFAGDAAAFAECGYESFGWFGGKSRTGGVKAVGSGADAGKTLYGKAAAAALAAKPGGDPTPPPSADRGAPPGVVAGRIAAAVRGQFPGAEFESAPGGWEFWRVPVGGDRAISVKQEPDRNRVLVNFYNTGGGLGPFQSGQDVRAGSLGLMKGLRGLADRLIAVGVGMAYNAPSDLRRAEWYARVLSAAGYVPDPGVDPAKGVHAWVDGRGLPPEDQARRLGEYRDRVSGAGLKAKYAEPFSEADDPFTVFDDAAPGGVPFLAPQAALGYFRGLVPTLGSDPQRYGPLLQRHAFTLAHATDQTLLEKVKAAILAKLGGETAAPGNVAVEDILDAAGVSPRNPQYGEMAYRTNMMDAYNAGASAELQAPEMREAFPAWRYEGIEDGREGEDHRPHFGRLYPSTAAFADVRGPRVWNCRCSATPVSKWELAELQKRGARVEAFGEVHAFDWTGARSRTGGPKAVGTGADAGKALYGQDAVNALKNKGKGGKADSEPGAKPAKKPAPEANNKGDDKPPARMAPRKEIEAARGMANAKTTAAPVPPMKKARENRRKLAEYGKAKSDFAKRRREGKLKPGEKEPRQRDYLDLRGSPEQRRKSAKALFEAFGGAEKGYVVCHGTGLKMHWTDDPAENPHGYPKFERGKIFTAQQGGGYDLANLIPESRAYNGSRNNAPVRTENMPPGKVSARVFEPGAASRIAGSPTAEHRAQAGKWAAASAGVPPESAAKYSEDMAHALSVLPAGVAKAAAEPLSGRGAVFYPDPKALRAAAEKIDGEKAPGVSGFAHDRGMHTDLHLDGGDDPRGTYVHELWHAADNGGFHSDDKGWQAAYKKDVLKGRHLLSRYATKNPSEGFAEFGRVLAERGEAEMAAKFPACVKHLKSKGLL